MNPETEQLIKRAREAYERRDYVAALADLREVAERSPVFADVRNLMGLCLSLLGQPESALEQFDAALEHNPGYIEAHLNRAITLNELGRFEEGQAAVEAAARHESEEGGRFRASVSARLANAHSSLGDLYLAASSPTDAEDQYRRALELRPGFHDIRNRLGEALMQRGALEEARQELEQALEGNGRFLRARLNLGLVHYRAERKDEAREEWEECRSQNPASPRVQAYLRLLEPRSPEDAGVGEAD